jgi:hypothetical protein
MGQDLDSTVHQRLLQRVRAEFLEMPGLRLTCEQARRLWGLDAETSSRLLFALVELKFLSHGADGRFSRLTEGGLPTRAHQMVQAGIPAGRSDDANRRTPGQSAGRSVRPRSK